MTMMKMPTATEKLEMLKRIDTTCDFCGKQRRDLQAASRDSNGDPDGGSICFICRKEYARGRVYSFKDKRYECHDYSY